MLLWCVLVLVASTFPIMYIPVINNKVFLIGPMKWEWGIDFAQIFVYLGASEGYKWGKRVLFRKKGVNVPMAAGMKDPEAQQRLSISSKATVREK
jgi:magnesium-transporting ATPase (P-type)